MGSSTDPYFEFFPIALHPISATLPSSDCRMKSMFTGLRTASLWASCRWPVLSAVCNFFRTGQFCLEVHLERGRSCDEWDVEEWRLIKRHPLPNRWLHTTIPWGHYLITDDDDGTSFMDLATSQEWQRIARSRPVKGPWVMPSQIVISLTVKAS